MSLFQIYWDCNLVFKNFSGKSFFVEYAENLTKTHDTVGYNMEGKEGQTEEEM